MMLSGIPSGFSGFPKLPAGGTGRMPKVQRDEIGEHAVMGILEGIGSRLIAFVKTLGEMLILLGQTLYFFREAPRNLQSIFVQMAIIGYDTLPVASVMA